MSHKILQILVALGAMGALLTGCGTTTKATNRSGPNHTLSILPAQSGLNQTAPHTVNTTQAAVVKAHMPLPQVSFYPQLWHNMGEVALLSTPDESGTPSGTLWVISSHAGHPPTLHRLAQHVISAAFSPDGKWISVVVANSMGISSHITTTYSLWIMSADGSTRHRIGVDPFDDGHWLPHKDAYVYGDNPIYQVDPSGRMKRLPLQLPENVRVTGIEPDPRRSLIAIDAVYPAANGQVVDRRDTIAWWNPSSGQVQKVHVASHSGDGYVLGHWTNNGKDLFFWSDPMHSASLLANGSTLASVSLSGKVTRIGRAQLGSHAVLPLHGDHALIQTAHGRYLYQQFGVAIWNGNQLNPIRPPSGHVLLWPDTNAQGSLVAFVEAPALTVSPTERTTRAWWSRLQLATYSPTNHVFHVYKNAGTSVHDPYISEASHAILFIDGNSLAWVSTHVKGPVHVVLSFGGRSWYGYPQWPGTESLQIMSVFNANGAGA